MNRIFSIFSILLVIFLVPIKDLYSKVDPPNYNFSLDTLKDFYPGADIKELEKKYGPPEVMSGGGGNLTIKFYVAHIRYKFPVIVQSQEGKILDMFAKLLIFYMMSFINHSLTALENKMSIRSMEKRPFTNGQSLHSHTSTAEHALLHASLFFILFFPLTKKQKGLLHHSLS
jgi:hypothetical protein